MSIDEIDRAYAAGQRRAGLRLLSVALEMLGETESLEAIAASWVSERYEAIAALRTLCGELGDNNWPDKLHLADIITKHVGHK